MKAVARDPAHKGLSGPGPGACCYASAFRLRDDDRECPSKAYES